MEARGLSCPPAPKALPWETAERREGDTLEAGRGELEGVTCGSETQEEEEGQEHCCWGQIQTRQADGGRGETEPQVTPCCIHCFTAHLSMLVKPLHYCIGLCGCIQYFITIKILIGASELRGRGICRGESSHPPALTSTRFILVLVSR